MVDTLTPAQRSYNMSRIRGTDTKPELEVRRTLHRLGYRFRLHSKILPGRPDIVLPRFQTVIFVHGCYWHRHRCRYGKVIPTTRREFWEEKFKQNVDRDKRVRRELIQHGWSVETIWECQTADVASLQQRLERILGSGHN